MRRSVCLIGLGFALLCPGIAPADPLTLDKPIPARVIVRNLDGKKLQGIEGTLTSVDDDSLSIHARDKDYTLHWTDLTGASEYALRSRLISKKDAQAWLNLGALTWELNDTADAKIALAQAGRLDASLKDDIDAVLASGAGILLDAGPELMHDAPVDVDVDVDADGTAAPANPKGPKPKYQKVNPAQAKAAILLARSDAKKVSEEMNISFAEVETPHFIIFTNWDPREYDFLKTNLESAYTCVSRQFDIPAEENIFVGKLCVFMFSTHDDFLRFGQKYDHLPADRTDIAGYYASRSAVMAHLVMSKPDEKIKLSGNQSQVVWAYILTHEFTHAFVARYRTSRNIPTWLNEGIAEVIASGQFPYDVHDRAVEVAKRHQSLADLFDDHASIQSGEMYPVMRTLVEVLILRDRKKFLDMFDEIKAGASGEKALKDNYNWTFDDLTNVWRQSLGVR